MIQHVTPYEGMCLSSDGALRGTSSGTASVTFVSAGSHTDSVPELQLKRAVKEKDWEFPVGPHCKDHPQ